MALSRLEGSRFLAFGDSRKMVERIVAAALRARKRRRTRPSTRESEDPDADVTEALVRILPYRAGYEAGDRQEIQRALSEGTFRASCPPARSKWASTSARSTLS